MSTNKRLRGSAAWAPVWLRVALGVTFVWAGLGKLVATAELPAGARPVLARMGAIAGETRGPAQGPASAPAPESQGGAKGGPGTKVGEVDSAALPSPGAGADGAGGGGDGEKGEDGAAGAKPEPAAGGAAKAAEAAAAVEGQADGPVTVRRVWGLGLRVYGSANPSPVADGAGGVRTPPAIWPRFVGSPGWSAFWGWSVAVAEVVFGVTVLIGLLTRVSGLSLAGVMLGALWLDQLGPAIQSGRTRLGFLPNHDIFDVRGWMPMLWQISLLCSAVAVVLLGSGRLAVDRWLFGSRLDDDHDEL